MEKSFAGGSKSTKFVNASPLKIFRDTVCMLCYALVLVNNSNSYITIDKKYFSETQLTGQNDRAACKRHGLSWRCIQCHETQSAMRLGPAGLAIATEREPITSEVELTFKQSENVAIALAS